MNPLEITPNPELQALQLTVNQQLDVSQHRVMLTAFRPDKTIEVPTDDIDEETQEPKTKKETEYVNRLAVPFQSLIVNRRVAFMNVKNIQLIADFDKDTNEERLYRFVSKIREDNKLRYKEVKVAQKLLRDLQVAKLYYFEETPKNNYADLNKGASKLRMRVKILAPSLGYTLIPVFDNYGNLVMFIVKSIIEDNTITEVFTDEYIHTYTNDELTDNRMNPLGKIPISYYSLEKPIWGDVQTMIDRFETIISNFADTIDYNGAPILLASGEIQGFSKKGERGKVFELTESAQMQYLTWDSAPDAIKLELDTLRELIYTCTQTPDISFQQMKGIGGITGVGMDRVFFDAQLGANEIIDGVYGEITQRDINLQKAGAVLIDTSLAEAEQMDIWFELEPYKFDDVADTVNTLATAYAAGLISQKSAVMNNPIVEGNGDEEYEQILAERSEYSMQQAEEEEDV